MNELRPYQAELIERLRQAYRDGFKSPCLVLPCGGGKSVIAAEIAKKAAEKGGRVLFLVHRKELAGQIRKTFYDWGADLSLCRVELVQTACRRLSRMPAPRLIITDENHHCPAKSYRKIYDAFPAAQRLGITATPVRLGGGGLGGVNDTLIEGVSAKWLIENRFLAPYDYYAPQVSDLSGVRTRRGEFVASDAAAALDRSAIYGDVIEHYRRLADGERAVCYCATVAHSEAMAARFSAAGIPAAHIGGETPSGERARRIAQFRAGEIRVLCNVDLISEGFDVPDCACSILLRPTHSLALYIQQSMRCMRWRPGKRAVIIDHVGNYLRFGLPDDAREWSLSPEKQKKRTVRDGFRIRQCPECFYTFPFAPACPKCGYVFPNPRAEIEEKTKAELTKVAGFTLDYKTPADCRSFAELREFAAAHGYKPGWAYYQAKARGWTA